MTRTAKKYLSLREVGKILKIPPSTVVYYRDRFSDYIPAKESGSGRLVYPRESLEVFSTIRQCYRQKLNQEQTGEILTKNFTRSCGMRRHTSDQNRSEAHLPNWPDPRMIENLTHSMERLALALTRQEEMQGRLDAMQEELKQLKEDRNRTNQIHNQTMRRLEKELEQLKSRRQAARQRQTDHFKDHRDGPGFETLNNPMTLRYPPDRYLGLRDHTGEPITLDQVIAVIRQNTLETGQVRLQWRLKEGIWTLWASLRKNSWDQEKKTIRIDIRPAETPKGNSVTEVLSMQVAGRRLSEDELMKFFKLLKTGMTDFPDPNESRAT